LASRFLVFTKSYKLILINLFYLLETINLKFYNAHKNAFGKNDGIMERRVIKLNPIHVMINQTNFKKFNHQLLER